MIRELAPPTKLNVRFVILAVTLVPLGIIPGIPIWGRLAGCVMPLILTGTYRKSKIIETRFETRFHFAFIPFPGIWTLILFGPLQFIMGWIFDFLIPSLGGPLEIWLITAKGREIKAWQGHNQDQFDTNLKLLQDHTTAELKTRSSC